MPATYSADIKTTRMTAVKDAIDAAGPGAYIEICSAAYAAVLATLPLAYPCGSVVGSVLTFNTTPPLEDALADNTGVAAVARVKNAAGVVKTQGLSVGTSLTDIVMGSVNITAGLKVQISSLSITHA
jgi:hypothetical protein